MNFIHQSVRMRVVFGHPASEQIPAEADRLGSKRIMIACTKGTTHRLDTLISGLGSLCVQVFDGAEAHCPKPVADAALAAFHQCEADCVLAIGGGSTIGLGKVITVETGQPMMIAPTTYSGSEMTPLYGVLVEGEKRTTWDERALPKTVIYDPALTTSLPGRLTATTGMNSLAHCVEAFYAEAANPLASMIAEAGLRAHARGLRNSVRTPDDLEARTQSLYGGMLGGMAVTQAGISLHHKLCHVIGGTGVPHGESNSVVLPHVIAFNASAAPDAMEAIQRALEVDDPAAGMYDLAREIGVPASLKELGMRKHDLDEVARLGVKATTWNPRPVAVPELRRLLEDAFHGIRPQCNELQSSELQ